MLPQSGGLKRPELENYDDGTPWNRRQVGADGAAANIPTCGPPFRHSVAGLAHGEAMV